MIVREYESGSETEMGCHWLKALHMILSEVSVQEPFDEKQYALSRMIV